MTTNSQEDRRKRTIDTDGYGHRTRFSDASSFDEICVTCYATDRRNDDRLNKPCTIGDRRGTTQ